MYKMIKMLSNMLMFFLSCRILRTDTKCNKND